MGFQDYDPEEPNPDTPWTESVFQGGGYRNDHFVVVAEEEIDDFSELDAETSGVQVID